MTVAILDSKKKKDIELLSDFAKKNNINIKFINNEDFEDYALSQAIKEGRKDDFIDVDEFLNELVDEN